MSTVANLIPKIRAFRPFLPAKDFQTSLSFYKAIGFEAHMLGETLAEVNLGPHAFLLQGYYVKEWAENTMMHVLVTDVHAWCQHIDALDLAARFGVQPPSPPKLQTWGLTVAYLFDPSGVLWHFAEVTTPKA